MGAFVRKRFPLYVYVSLLSFSHPPNFPHFISFDTVSLLPVSTLHYALHNIWQKFIHSMMLCTLCILSANNDELFLILNLNIIHSVAFSTRKRNHIVTLMHLQFAYYFGNVHSIQFSQYFCRIILCVLRFREHIIHLEKSQVFI